jgi:hypothetical protein
MRQVTFSRQDPAAAPATALPPPSARRGGGDAVTCGRMPTHGQTPNESIESNQLCSMLLVKKVSRNAHSYRRNSPSVCVRDGIVRCRARYGVAAQVCPRSAVALSPQGGLPPYLKSQPFCSSNSHQRLLPTEDSCLARATCAFSHAHWVGAASLRFGFSFVFGVCLSVGNRTTSWSPAPLYLITF